MTTKPSTCTSKTLLSVLACLLAVGCVSSRPDRFPDTDIVYESGVLDDARIGFVNTDGSNNKLLSVDDPYLARPIWSADGKTLYLLRWSGAGGQAGRVAVWREGRVMHICRNQEWPAVTSIGAIIPGLYSTQAIINNAGYQLLLINLDSCRELEKYVDVANAQSAYIMGFSLSSDGTHLLYTEVPDRHSASPEYAIKVMDVSTGKTVKVGEGINPTWSPDDQWIAYTRLDGIYVMAFDGSRSRRLVEYDSTEWGNHFIASPPSPRWSPDGKWLVYHRCVQWQTCSYTTEFSIFKVEVATATEVKIVDGGINPFWRSRQTD